MKISAVWQNDTALAVKKRLFLLFMLNLSDWICTLTLLKTGLFKEANPLMRSVITSYPLGFALKVIMPFSLIVYAFMKLKDADRRQILISNNIALAGVGVYFLLNLYHLICFATLHLI